MASNTISILIQAKDNASRTISGVSDNVDDSAKRAQAADAAFASFAKTIGRGLIAAGALSVVGLTKAIHATGDYQSSLSQLRQASGATEEQMGKLSDLTRQLGRDNTLAGVTAADAARTMVELSKAGLTVKDTMAASRGVMQLAKAGNIEFADAAVIAASALNAFGLEGKDATKVADQLAAGANASQADLSDLALGLQQSATVAKQFKLSLNENITALSLFANNGIRGSDAGTSLKTMLISLAKPSDSAAAAMKEIGFNAYDAQGQFVGLKEMSSRLHDSLKGLTKQQQQNALATIFGTDAFRAAAVLADNAGDSYEKMSKDVGKAGAAHKAAAAQMGPFDKATENLNNQLSDLGLAIGERVLPYLTDMTNGMSTLVSNITSGLPGAISTFRDWLPTIQAVTVGVTTFAFAQNAALMATRAMAVAQGALNAVMRANPIALLIGGTAALITAYVNVVASSASAKSASDRLRDARQRQADATRNAKDAEYELKDAQYSAEGAALEVERAQRTYNDTVAKYGPKSLEAREAAHALKGAQERLRDANQQVKDKTKEAQKAEKERADAKDAVIKANDLVKDSAYRLAGGYANIGKAVQDAKKQVENFPKYDIGNRNAAELGIPARNAHASGTPYAPGGLTLVGERGPELVQLPRGSRVSQAYETRQALSQGAGGGTVTLQVYGNVVNQTPEAANAWWDGVNKASRLARGGMA